MAILQNQLQCRPMSQLPYKCNQNRVASAGEDLPLGCLQGGEGGNHGGVGARGVEAQHVPRDLLVTGLGFRVQGSGFRVWGSEFRI